MPFTTPASTSTDGGQGVNLLRNSSFEAIIGTVYSPNWWTAGTGSVAYVTGSGGYGVRACQFTAGAASQGLSNTIANLFPSTTYTASAYVKVAAGSTVEVLTTGATTNLALSSTSTTFTRVTGQFVTDSSGTTVTLIIRASGNGHVVTMDNVKVEVGSVATAYSPSPRDEVLSTLMTANMLDIASTDCPVTANAALIQDPVNPSIIVSVHTDAVDAGRTLMLRPPAWATRMLVTESLRASASDPGVCYFGRYLKYRSQSHTAAWSSWSSAVTLLASNISAGSTNFFSYRTTIALTGITPGTMHQLEYYRAAPGSGTEHPADMYLRSLEFQFD